MLYSRFTKSFSIGLSPAVFQKVKDLSDVERISMGAWFRNVADKEIKSLEGVKNAETHR